MEQKELTLSLINHWFEMTDPNGKTEDYRSITPYWCNRLLLFKGESKSKKWWESKFKYPDIDNIRWVRDSIVIENFSFKQFDTNKMTLGYPKKDNFSRIKRFEHKGIEIRTGKPEWGAEPNKLYFVIKHGEKLWNK